MFWWEGRLARNIITKAFQQEEEDFCRGEERSSFLEHKSSRRGAQPVTRTTAAKLALGPQRPGTRGLYFHADFIPRVRSYPERRENAQGFGDTAPRNRTGSRLVWGSAQPGMLSRLASVWAASVHTGTPLVPAVCWCREQTQTHPCWVCSCIFQRPTAVRAWKVFTEAGKRWLPGERGPQETA